MPPAKAVSAMLYLSVDVRRGSESRDRTPSEDRLGDEYEEPKPVNEPLLLQPLDDDELSRSGCLSLPSVISNGPINLAASSQNTLRASSNYASPMEAEREEVGARITHSSTYEDLVLTDSQELA
ncbi:hypothetical protein Ciccas_009754 [Cichlidogyrus casuarinus]|uniref:Uncharacterized protein n=1 Tax=Cichlidogyrus casuarinus TaxID=1844966 RepID=A0ABD2PXL4_9PLAT